MRELSIENIQNFVDEEGLVSLTRKLIQIPSVYRPNEPNGNEEKVARFIESSLK